MICSCLLLFIFEIQYNIKCKGRQTQATNKKITKPKLYILSGDTCKIFKRPCDKTSITKPQRFGDALGPFPRSVWIHPCTPEGSLDRACGIVFKRSVLCEQRTLWQSIPSVSYDRIYGFYFCGLVKESDNADSVSDPTVTECKYTMQL